MWRCTSTPPMCLRGVDRKNLTVSSWPANCFSPRRTQHATPLLRAVPAAACIRLLNVRLSDRSLCRLPCISWFIQNFTDVSDKPADYIFKVVQSARQERRRAGSVREGTTNERDARAFPAESRPSERRPTSLRPHMLMIMVTLIWWLIKRVHYNNSFGCAEDLHPTVPCSPAYLYNIKPNTPALLYGTYFNFSLPFSFSF